MLSETWNALYEPKERRIAERSGYEFVRCDECKRFGGHEYTCSKCTHEDLIRLTLESRKAEDMARKLAAKYLAQLNLLAGKVAILKNENNKLRRANHKLKKASADNE